MGRVIREKKSLSVKLLIAFALSTLASRSIAFQAHPQQQPTAARNPAASASTPVPSGRIPSAEAPNTLPPAWAGDWDGIGFLNNDPTFPKDLKIDPLHEQTDPFIVAHLLPAALAKREATSYDHSPGSLCDPEGWFPFINYGYGFALLASPGKITMVPVEPDTEGIRRAYFKPTHAKNLKPTWNGDSIARWEGDTLVIDTVGYNDLSWLGDDREPHSTELHMVERMRLIRDNRYLEVETEISDPKTLTSPYKLIRFFQKVYVSHLGAGPDDGSLELVCNEDLSPFSEEGKKATPPVAPPK